MHILLEADPRHKYEQDFIRAEVPKEHPTTDMNCKYNYALGCLGCS